ncbi:tetrathionate reductase two-component response regulator [Vibrio sp. RC586]|uniref:response regulator transcription factor n=1 Tax=Vibrio sp. RC586 TaxID=675815 RepID=UPI0001BB830F|nr:response regulator [Vibrio sp. RC586]EEZ00188.1 tetrathionate reductase two-component response regulator [Vibrio sp. RC586]
MFRNLHPVYLVDDEISVLESLQFLLESYGYQLQAFSCGRQFLEQANWQQAGCVVLDSRMPDLCGQEVQRQLNARNSPLRIIYLTGHGDVPMAVEALKEGACDFFQKPVDGDALVRAIDQALELSAICAEQCNARRKIGSLTKRERDVAELVLKGMKNQEMADELCVSLRTIEVHRANLMKKLEVNNMAALIRYMGSYLPA